MSNTLKEVISAFKQVSKYDYNEIATISSLFSQIPTKITQEQETQIEQEFKDLSMSEQYELVSQFSVLVPELQVKKSIDINELKTVSCEFYLNGQSASFNISNLEQIKEIICSFNSEGTLYNTELSFDIDLDDGIICCNDSYYTRLTPEQLEVVPIDQINEDFCIYYLNVYYSSPEEIYINYNEYVLPGGLEEDDVILECFGEIQKEQIRETTLSKLTSLIKESDVDYYITKNDNIIITFAQTN